MRASPNTWHSQHTGWMYRPSTLVQSRSAPTGMLFYGSSPAIRPKACLGAYSSSKAVPRTNGRNKQGAASTVGQPRTAAAQDTAAGTASRQRSSTSSSTPDSWSQRMAGIQELMAKVQQQLQQHAKLDNKDLELAQGLKAKAEQHLDLLMQLAEAEQRQITGDMQPEQLHQVLQSLQQQLEQEQQEALTAIQQQPTGPSPNTDSANGSGSSSNSKQSSPTKGVYLQEHRDLLDATAEIHSAIQRASADLSNKQQDLQQLQYTSEMAHNHPASTSEGKQDCQDAQTTVEAAESAIQNTQDLLRDYDHMCQRAFELSRKLSQAEAENVELKGKLDDVKADYAAATEELADHRELQMQYDKQCQDMYKLRMMLQQAQAAGGEVADQAAGTANKYKRDISWLMEAHRGELAEEHHKNQDLIQLTQELRLRLLEVEQQLWGQNVCAYAPGAQTQQPATTETAAGATDAQEQQQEQQEEQQQLGLVQQLQDAVQQLMQEKQQLMKSLQDMQREQAVLLMELQGLQQEQQQQTAAASDSLSRTSATAAVDDAATASTAEAALQQQLEEAELQHTALIEQVQELQHSLKEAREAAAGAAVAQEQVASTATAMTGSTSGANVTGIVAAEQQLTEMKAQMVQLRGQLADTRCELHHVTGRVAAAETALQQQAAHYEARLEQLQTLYSKQTVVVAQLRKGKVPAANAVGFSNTNRFWVRQELLFEFLKHWVIREGLLQQQDGFLGLQVQPVPGVTADSGVDVIVTSLWETIPQWEAWSKSDAARQQHMPTGVYQYVPEKGEGFPEDFVPFRDYDDAVNAKY